MESGMDGISAWFFGLSAAYGVNPWVFGILYVGGIPLFLADTAWIVRRLRRGRSIAFQALIAGYLAVQPYLYVALVGDNIPRWVWGVIGALIAIGIWSTWSKISKAKAEIDTGARA